MKIQRQKKVIKLRNRCPKKMLKTITGNLCELKETSGQLRGIQNIDRKCCLQVGLL